MSTKYKREYEPWQKGVDKQISFFLDADVRDKLHIKKDNILTLGKRPLKFARYLSYRRSPENDRLSVEWLRYSSKAYAAYFELARQPKKKQTIKILDCPPVTWDGSGIIENGRVYPQVWQEAYFTAAIMRDRESMDSLARFPVDILRKSATKTDNQEYLLVEAIQSLHFGRSDYLTKMITLSRSFDFKTADDWLLYITMGKLETLLSFTTDMETSFNDTLAKNLGNHRLYYERNTPEDQEPVNSWIAIVLLGMACMVYDRNESVTIDSEYIPRFYIEGTYL